MGKKRVRKVMGLPMIEGEGGLSSWELDGNTYTWCPMRQVRMVSYGGVAQAIVGWVNSLEAAVALTIGLHDGAGLAQRTPWAVLGLRPVPPKAEPSVN